jgi:hypothetical protein
VIFLQLLRLASSLRAKRSNPVVHGLPRLLRTLAMTVFRQGSELGVTVQTLTVIAIEAKQSSGSWIAAVAAHPRNDGIPARV